MLNAQKAWREREGPCRRVVCCAASWAGCGARDGRLRRRRPCVQSSCVHYIPHSVVVVFVSLAYSQISSVIHSSSPPLSSSVPRPVCYAVPAAWHLYPCLRRVVVMVAVYPYLSLCSVRSARAVSCPPMSGPDLYSALLRDLFLRSYGSRYKYCIWCIAMTLNGADVISLGKATQRSAYIQLQAIHQPASRKEAGLNTVSHPTVPSASASCPFNLPSFGQQILTSRFQEPVP